MPTLTLTDEQVIELVRQQSPELKRAVLLALAEDARTQREARLEYAETQLRRLCAERDYHGEFRTPEFRDTIPIFLTLDFRSYIVGHRKGKQFTFLIVYSSTVYSF